MLKMTISSSVLGLQHPNAGGNIQHLMLITAKTRMAVRRLDLRLQNKFRLLLIITFICCLSETFVFVLRWQIYIHTIQSYERFFLGTF